MSKGEAFGIILLSTFADPDFRSVGPTAQIIYLVELCHRNGKTGEAWLGKMKLGDILGGLGKRAIEVAFKKLRKVGLIKTKVSRINGEIRSVITFPKLDQSADICALPQSKAQKNDKQSAEKRKAKRRKTQGKAQKNAQISADICASYR